MATRQNLILVGGGGHCRSCIDVIETGGKFKIAGIVDIKDKTGTKVLGYKITGSDGDLPALVKKFKSVLITIGQIKSPAKRKEKYETLKKLGAKFPTVISPKTHISKYSKVGQGTIIMHAVVINANVSVGEKSYEFLIFHDENASHVAGKHFADGGANRGVFRNHDGTQGIQVPDGLGHDLGLQTFGGPGDVIVRQRRHALFAVIDPFHVFMTASRTT